MRTYSNTTTGFMLIEVLTTITITVILAGLLLPILGNVRRKPTKGEAIAFAHAAFKLSS